MKSREKIVTKITRDGAVEINKDSGEIKRVSSRESELTLKKDIESAELPVKDNLTDIKSVKPKQQTLYAHIIDPSPETPTTPQNPISDTVSPVPKPDEIVHIKSRSGIKGKLNQLSRFKRNRKRYKADKKLLKNQAKSDVNAPHPNRIQFTDEERNNPKLKKHIDRSEQAVTKLEKAIADLPVKKKLKIEHNFDENSGKGKNSACVQRGGKTSEHEDSSLTTEPSDQ